MKANTGSRIRNLRKEKNWTLQELADKVGITKGAMGMIENNHRTPSMDTLRKIATALDVEPGLLIGEVIPGIEDNMLAEAFFRAQTLSPEDKQAVLDFIAFRESLIVNKKK